MVTSVFSDGRLRVTFGGLAWRRCDEGALVFDEKSGNTSLLNRQGLRLLEILLSKSSVSVEDARMELGLHQANDLAEFDDLIYSLQQAGLVDP